MPDKLEYVTVPMRVKRTDLDPCTRTLTVTLEQFDATQDTADLLDKQAVTSEPVDVVISKAIR